MGRKRKMFTGWRLFGLTVFVVILLWYADDRFCRASDAKGFYPPGTYCMISSWDFPRAWAALAGGDVLARMNDDWPHPSKSLELATRLDTGIRPTPNRWSIWLGKRTVFAFAPEGVGITAYPGHLLRWAASLQRILGEGPDAVGIATYRGYSYAWRDGYLIASASRDFVAAALSSEHSPRLHSEVDVLLTVQWTGKHSGYLNVLRGDGLPVSGQVEFTAHDGDRALTLPQAWPAMPVASLTARNANDLMDIGSAIDQALAAFPVYIDARTAASAVINAWSLQSPGASWDSGPNDVSVALLSVNSRAGLALPNVACAFRYSEDIPGTGPFTDVFANRERIPFEWNGNHGFLVPLLGTEWSPCIAKAPHDWIVTSRQVDMADIAGNMADGPACSADVDVALRVSWEKLGKCAEDIAQTLGAAGVFPRMNGEDVRADVVPKITAMSTLGTVEIDGSARGGTLKFSGHLAKPAERE